MNHKIKDNLFATAITAMVIALVIVLNVVLYYLSAINGWYIANAEELDLSLSGSTEELFAEAEEKGRRVEIIFCMSREELAVNTTGKDVLATAEALEELHPDFIKLRFFNIKTLLDEDGNSVKARLEKYKTDMRGKETAIHAGAVIFSSTVTDGAGFSREDYVVLNNQLSGVPYVDFYHLDGSGYITAYVGEEVMASMVLWTLNTEHKTAYFTTGHGETVDIAFTNMLQRAGYYISEVDLLRNDKNQDGVPDYNLAEAGVVVISNPTADFLKSDDVMKGKEIETLSSYVNNYGGSLYVSLDPYAAPLKNLEEFLTGYGITVATGVDSDGRTVRNIIRESSNALPGEGGYTFVANYANNEIGAALAEKTDEYVSDQVLVKNVGALTLTGDAKPVLVTSGTASAYAGGEAVGSSGEYCVGALATKAGAGGEGKVFVTSGIYLTASEAVISDLYANRNFTYALFETVFGASTAPYGCKTVPYSTDRLDVTMGTARLYTLLVMSIPAVLAVVGVVINKRRKNR